MANSSNKNKKKTNSAYSFIYGLVITLLICIILFSGYACFWEVEPYIREHKEHKELLSLALVSDNSSEDTNESMVDFNYLQSVNSDCIGYIEIPDTKLSYPIVKSSDNADYLDVNFLGEKSKCGSIFLDCRSNPDFTDKNTIVYGHNMKDGSMFRTLNEYSDVEFYKAHPVVYLYLPNKETMKLNIISAYITNPKDEIYTDLSSLTSEESNSIIDKSINKSLYKTDFTYEEGKPIVTLSTCRGTNNARFILILQ